eukprot:TRINITY_DN18000_c0_g1_i1.p1 TRINITY_DN18000_c0_g1~~TRINITY_DN18000_c0_g1_i1.p1  ORF type:complete len:402 (+),score=110.99 TRINITY_DN18000_c0_g1_i1:92-1297(+)
MTSFQEQQRLDRLQMDLDLVGADMRVEGMIGGGTYGEVFSAVCLVTGARYALKHVDKLQTGQRILGDTMQAMRTYREISLLTHFHHGNIVGLERVLRFPADFNMPLQKVILVENNLDGDLFGVLHHHRNGIPAVYVQYFMYQLLHGVKALHDAGVLHGDLHPGNICIKRDNTLVIIDLNLARAGSSGDYAMTALEYRAPELLMEAPNYDARLDLFSAGCVFAHMLNGQCLFPSEQDCKWAQLCTVIRGIGIPSPEDIGEVGAPHMRARLQAHLNNSSPQNPAWFFRSAPDKLARLEHELLRELLTYNPRKRIGAADALRHPYFKYAADGHDGLHDEEHMAGITRTTPVVIDEELANGGPAAICAAIDKVAKVLERSWKHEMLLTQQSTSAHAADHAVDKSG